MRLGLVICGLALIKAFKETPFCLAMWERVSPFRTVCVRDDEVPELGRLDLLREVVWEMLMDGLLKNVVRAFIDPVRQWVCELTHRYIRSEIKRKQTARALLRLTDEIGCAEKG